MKMQVVAELGIQHRIEQILDLVIDVLANIKDYFFYEHITLFEAFLFGLALFSRCIWFSIFGAENANYDYYFSTVFWIIVFGLITIVHLTGFFTGWLWARSLAMYAHAVIWLFMTFLATISRTTAPEVPTFLLYTFFSLIVIVRISRERLNLKGR